MHTSCHSRGETSLLKVTRSLFLVTHCLLGLEFLTESLIRRDALLAEVATPSPLPLMQLFQHRMISYSRGCLFFALASIRVFRLLQVRVRVLLGRAIAQFVVIILLNLIRPLFCIIYMDFSASNLAFFVCV